jgi:outer membrane protein
MDLKLQHDWQLAPHLSLTSSAAIALGGDRYMQTWFGVTPEQSARSGLPVYEPHLGLRDLSLALALKAELGHHWVVIGGPGYTRMLGPAARSPLVQRRSAWSASAGVGYRF